MVWGRDPKECCFCMWIFRFPSTICWKDYSFLIFTIVKNQLTIYWRTYFRAFSSISLIYIFSLMLVPFCVDYCSFVIYKLESVSPQKFFFLFKIILATWGSLFHWMHFRIRPSISANKPVGILTRLHWICRSIGGVLSSSQY